MNKYLWILQEEGFPHEFDVFCVVNCSVKERGDDPEALRRQEAEDQRVLNWAHQMRDDMLRRKREEEEELEKQKSFIEKVILEEENSFYRTLDQGLKKMDQVCAYVLKNKEKTARKQKDNNNAITA